MDESQQADASVVTALFRHNRWANLKLLEACAGLSAEQLDERAIGGFGTIAETLRHLVNAEASYVRRVSGAEPPQPLPREEFVGVERLSEAAAWAGDELLKIALATKAGDLVREQAPNDLYPLASLMLQVINHATEHRTQIAAALTKLGIEPPEMDGWAYMDQHDQFQPREA